MKLYDCKVRLHGDVRDEVRKSNVTSAEIRVLQQVHGEDAVSEIIPTGGLAHSQIPERTNELCDDVEERDRLSRLYGEKVVAVLFGAPQVSVSSEISSELVKALPDIVPIARRGRPPKLDVEQLIG